MANASTNPLIYFSNPSYVQFKLATGDEISMDSQCALCKSDEGDGFSRKIRLWDGGKAGSFYHGNCAENMCIKELDISKRAVKEFKEASLALAATGSEFCKEVRIVDGGVEVDVDTRRTFNSPDEIKRGLEAHNQLYLKAKEIEKTLAEPEQAKVDMYSRLLGQIADLKANGKNT